MYEITSAKRKYQKEPGELETGRKEQKGEGVAMTTRREGGKVETRVQGARWRGFSSDCYFDVRQKRG